MRSVKRYNYTWTDRGWRELHTKFGLGIGADAKVHLKVGVVGAAANQMHEDSGLTVEEIAILNEFGSKDGHTPERSFIRSTLRENRGKIERMMRIATSRVVFKRVPVAAALRVVGHFVADEIRKKIFSGVQPENAEATVEKKGHGMTLRDSFILASSIGYEVISGLGRFLGSNLE